MIGRALLFLLFFLPCVYAGLALPNVSLAFGLAAGVISGWIASQMLE